MATCSSQRPLATPAVHKYARALVGEAIKLVHWLHDQRLERPTGAWQTCAHPLAGFHEFEG